MEEVQVTHSATTVLVFPPQRDTFDMRLQLAGLFGVASDVVSHIQLWLLLAVISTTIRPHLWCYPARQAVGKEKEVDVTPGCGVYGADGGGEEEGDDTKGHEVLTVQCRTSPAPNPDFLLVGDGQHSAACRMQAAR